jgi:GT2 family glycosyltransferase
MVVHVNQDKLRKKQKTYIIIVNFGTPGHTIECLESVSENNHQHFQVVVVDVSNINKSVEIISKWIEEKKDDRFVLIEERENKGFAFANNIGIKYSLRQDDFGFLWVLNNDTVIPKNSLEELIKCYERKKEKGKIGFIGSKIMDYEKKKLIQNVGGTFNKWTGYSVLIGMGENDTGQFDNKQLKIDYVIGASMFCHSSLIQEIGLMPDDYFLYYEDIDWCITAQKAGFENLTCTKSLVFHKQGISTGAKLLTNDNHLKNKKYLYLSYLKFYKRHYKLFLPVAYFILIKQMAGKIFHNKFNEAKLIMKVMFTKS